jgi:hypothetical protein
MVDWPQAKGGYDRIILTVFGIAPVPTYLGTDMHV